MFGRLGVSGRWIEDCKRIVDQLKGMGDTKGQDRLDMVRTIRFTLYALQRTLSGWIEWVSNPDIMASFSGEELKEIGKTLAELTLPLIEYDYEITSRAQRDLRIREPERRSESPEKARDKTKVFYVR